VSESDICVQVGHRCPGWTSVSRLDIGVQVGHPCPTIGTHYDTHVLLLGQPGRRCPGPLVRVAGGCPPKRWCGLHPGREAGWRGPLRGDPCRSCGPIRPQRMGARGWLWPRGQGFCVCGPGPRPRVAGAFCRCWQGAGTTRPVRVDGGRGSPPVDPVYHGSGEDVTRSGVEFVGETDGGACFAHGGRTGGKVCPWWRPGGGSRGQGLPMVTAGRWQPGDETYVVQQRAPVPGSRPVPDSTTESITVGEISLDVLVRCRPRPCLLSPPMLQSIPVEQSESVS
jgi:hypothetical protein